MTSKLREAITDSLNELYHGKPPFSFHDDEINEAIDWQENEVRQALSAIIDATIEALPYIPESQSFQKGSELSTPRDYRSDGRRSALLDVKSILEEAKEK